MRSKTTFVRAPIALTSVLIRGFIPGSRVMVLNGLNIRKTRKTWENKRKMSNENAQSKGRILTVTSEDLDGISKQPKKGESATTGGRKGETCEMDDGGIEATSISNEIVPERTTMKSSQFKASRKYACLCIKNPLAMILMIISTKKTSVKIISHVHNTDSLLSCPEQSTPTKGPFSCQNICG